MLKFDNLGAAASYAMRARRPMLVFEGPAGGYVVVVGSREAHELEGFGLVPLPLADVAKEARR
ncbi:MAG: hypothetical protein M3R38_32860 [Actinomycetota bacterium]|nr:hypothetical protein [Actinomycetota bacterium]